MNCSDIKIRLAQPEDLKRIADIFSRSFRTLEFLPELHTFDEDFGYWRDVVMKEQRVCVAEQNGAVLGVMATKDGWLNHLYVDPECRNQGVGSILIADAQSRMKHISLWCFQQNEPARQFYEQHGFVAKQFTNGEANEESCPDARYEWSRN